MSLLIENIRLKLIDNLKLKSLKIIDNTSLHKKHKFFSKEKLHLKLIINSPELRAKSTLESNRIIHGMLKEELKNNIHSLQIQFE